MNGTRDGKTMENKETYMAQIAMQESTLKTIRDF
jgi:hypothetical protein